MLLQRLMADGLRVVQIQLVVMLQQKLRLGGSEVGQQADQLGIRLDSVFLLISTLHSSYLHCKVWQTVMDCIMYSRQALELMPAAIRGCFTSEKLAPRQSTPWRRLQCSGSCICSADIPLLLVYILHQKRGHQRSAPPFHSADSKMRCRS